MSFLHVVDRLLLSSGPGLPSSDARAWPGFDARRLGSPVCPPPGFLQPGVGSITPFCRGSRELVAVTWLPKSPVVGPLVE